MTCARCSVGFTLVEVVAALAVGGLVTLTAAATVASIPELAARADANLSSTLRAGAVRAHLREWLRASHASGDSAYDGAFIGVDGPPTGTDVLQFPVADPLGTIAGRASIRLAIDGPPDGGSSLVAEIRPEHGPTRRIELVRGARRLEARYLYFVSNEPRWFTGWGSEVERPAAVRIWIDGENLHPLIRLPLTVWLRS